MNINMVAIICYLVALFATSACYFKVSREFSKLKSEFYSVQESNNTTIELINGLYPYGNLTIRKEIIGATFLNDRPRTRFIFIYKGGIYKSSGIASPLAYMEEIAIRPKDVCIKNYSIDEHVLKIWYDVIDDNRLHRMKTIWGLRDALCKSLELLDSECLETVSVEGEMDNEKGMDNEN